MHRFDLTRSQRAGRRQGKRRAGRPATGIDLGSPSRWLGLLMMLAVFVGHDILTASASHIPTDPASTSAIHVPPGEEPEHAGHAHLQMSDRTVGFDCQPVEAVLRPSLDSTPDIDGCMPETVIELARPAPDPIAPPASPSLSSAVRRAMLQVYLN